MKKIVLRAISVILICVFLPAICVAQASGETAAAEHPEWKIIENELIVSATFDKALKGDEVYSALETDGLPIEKIRLSWREDESYFPPEEGEPIKYRYIVTVSDGADADAVAEALRALGYVNYVEHNCIYYLVEIKNKSWDIIENELIVSATFDKALEGDEIYSALGIDGFPIEKIRLSRREDESYFPPEEGEPIRYRYIVTLSDAAAAAEFCKKMINKEYINYIENNCVYHPCADPSVNLQWGFAKIGTQEARDKSFGGSFAIGIGVLDSGLMTTHEEFGANINTSLGRDVFLNNSNITDINGHGTEVTGIIAAEINTVGIEGICGNVSIVPIKITENEAADTTADLIAAGIEYAAYLGLDIINISYNILPSGTETVLEAAGSFDGLIVSACGNENVLMTNGYNGHCNELSNWIVVGASTINDTVWGNSNYSPIYVDIFAPGCECWTTWIVPFEDFTGEEDNAYYCYSSGTSIAAPHVAAAAIIMAKAPHYTVQQIKSLLMDTSVQSTAFSGKCVSGGRLSIINAVNRLYTESRPAYSRGDADGNGFVATEDYLMIKRVYLGTYTPDSQQRAASDIDGDGAVTVADYMMAKRFVLNTYYFAPIF